MNNSVNIEDREKAKEIAKTSESIRKKYRALRTGRMVENAALERRFKPIIGPFKQIAGSNANVESNVDVKTESPSMSTSVETKSVILKPEKKIKRKEKLSPVALTSPKRKLLNHPLIVLTSTRALQYEELHGMSHESSPIDNLPIDDNDENVFETPDGLSATSVRRQSRTFEGQQTLCDHFDPLDYVYGVRLSNDGAMLGDKRIDVNRDDNIIIGETGYMGTPGLYELVFKEIPDDFVYTEADMQKYKSILLATNAHRREYLPQNPTLGNKEHKYKHIIAPLML
ncbi:hypothetical protein EAI_03471 [Harpegnathos saltator]|uniref:DUF8207 domain-containing protein n=1 Tax=Harpegnathos saltator TaxID=610380 RepID=E2BXR5_HARSA|nr:hypothetical protein EAI_03471 [Harpegnathos saltator]